MQTNMHEAKSKLSQLVEAAVLGEEVIIAKSGKPLVRLVPFQPHTKREFGLLKGKIKMSSDFDSKEVNDEISEMFGM
ncbi:type II toxin-antitoxin system Phd/YefM family antitoxin [Paraglaciecola sp. MB-3u-78]|jgi:prevent-host-death family protein|uniref:type II toxin-antitoxin system Phd/YefM family antitoxin n=1 Tax=Paraglaciecola sp. MB-3u-78 TaxID=2058332 RepID=UPI000C32ABCC|nr:type II toxin-antitoxin system prevent-host-death family antitoxin [Paraglaciecola sp. MB-3u-78]PKG99133.1 type II toxin-antitoxin system prevent-host-death family antitoxin [Paraglaciecola sp. MB-3u-78]